VPFTKAHEQAENFPGLKKHKGVFLNNEKIIRSLSANQISLSDLSFN